MSCSLFDRGDVVEVHASILDCIGETPLVALDRFAPPDGGRGRVLGKLEMLNPYSVKDRAAATMILEAEKRGDIAPGKSTIIEATSGNTGIGLAMTCAARGYELVLCMSEAMSDERKKILKALGAKLELTPKIEHTRGAKARALELLREIPDSFYICQHHNTDNVLAHTRGTAEELWRQTDGEIAAFVAGLGTCGTLCGVSGTLRRKGARVHTVGIEPAEAPFYRNGHFEPHGIPGVVPGFRPENYDPELIDEIIDVPSQTAWQTVRELARREGILVGPSSGATVWAARELAGRPEFSGKPVVAVLADSGERYLTMQGLFEDRGTAKP
jgi:cysteine synthase A